MKKPSKTKPQKVPAVEREQVRARKAVGHDFALTVDGHGRTRLRTGTAESARRYETAGSGVVRIRNVDPLVGISSLTVRQQEAGKRYREQFEACAQTGLKGISLHDMVDGGRAGCGIPLGAIDAGRSFHGATDALGHWDVVTVVQAVCCSGHSISVIADATYETRDVTVRILKIGLDLLAVHYGTTVARKPQHVPAITS